MSQYQYDVILRLLDTLQTKADKAVLITPDEVSILTSHFYLFGKPVDA